MEEIQGEYIEKLHLINTCISPIIIICLLLNFCYICIKKRGYITYHLHLVAFALSFLLKLSLYFMETYIQSFLFWISQSLLFTGIGVVLYTLYSIYDTTNKCINFIYTIIIGTPVFHFTIVLFFHSIFPEYATFALLLVSIYSYVCYFITTSYMIHSLKEKEQRFNKRYFLMSLIFQLITLGLNIFWCILSVISTDFECYRNPLYDLSNSLLLVFLSVIISNGMVALNIFTKYKELVGDDEDSITTKPTIDISFLTHRKQRIETQHSIIGTTCFLGQTVTYKQINHEELFAPHLLKEDLLKLKSLKYHSVQQTEGMSVTNLNVYVVYKHHFCHSMNEILQTNHIFPEYSTLKIMKGIINGLLTLEHHGILHYHFTLNNILINESKDKAIVVDFLPILKWWFNDEKEYPLFFEISQQHFIEKIKKRNVILIKWLLYRLVAGNKIGNEITENIDINKLHEDGLFYNLLVDWSKSDTLELKDLSEQINYIQYPFLYDDENKSNMYSTFSYNSILEI